MPVRENLSIFIIAFFYLTHVLDVLSLLPCKSQSYVRSVSPRFSDVCIPLSVVLNDYVLIVVSLSWRLHVLLPDKLMCRVHHWKLGWIWVSLAEDNPAWKKERLGKWTMALWGTHFCLGPSNSVSILFFGREEGLRQYFED